MVLPKISENYVNCVIMKSFWDSHLREFHTEATSDLLIFNRNLWEFNQYILSTQTRKPGCSIYYWKNENKRNVSSFQGLIFINFVKNAFAGFSK